MKEEPQLRNKSDHSQALTGDRIITEDNVALDRIMETQGECKIDKFQFLKSNRIKGIILTILLIVSIVGIFALKYSKKLRAFVYYDNCNISDANHVFITGTEEEEEIVQFRDGRMEYKKLSYKYMQKNNRFIPITYVVQENFEQFSSQSYQKSGLNDNQVSKRVQEYGLNEHKVDIPGFFQFMFERLTGPFYILQYFFCVSFILTDYVLFGVALIVLIVLVTIINYLILYYSYKDIKQLAQKQFEVPVIRSGITQKILNTQVVPGDIFVPQGQIMCDALVLKGDVFVNQANLTGESHPIGKFPITSLKSTYEDYKWLHEGSHVFETGSETLAVAINTGFKTKRGRIIRRILTKEETQPQIFKSALSFVAETSIFSFITFGIYLVVAQAYGFELSSLFQAIMFFDILAAFIPSPMAIFFSLNYSFSLARLRYKNIKGTSLVKTVEGALTKVICFDKTGTITQSAVNLKKIFNIQNNSIERDIKEQILQKKEYGIVLNLLATCHTTRKINDEFEGDQIDKEIFIFSKHKLTENKSKDAIITIQSQEGNILEILKVNQFQSRFQSMSVLVRDASSKKIYAFIKGAPEKIFNNSINKPNKFHETIQSLSLGGYRTIAIGYKEIGSDEFSSYLADNRQIYEQGISMFGLLAFENKVKENAKEAMQKLKESNIETKMITGDNIYIGIETAIRCGILDETEKVIVLEGRNQINGKQRTFTGKVLQKTDTFVKEQAISLSETQYQNQSIPIAIDNNFLTLEPAPKIVSKILIFSRIPPENKALIVRTIKNQYIEKNEAKGFCYSLAKGDRPKVGMCGDGANDLLALREADLSLGIQECDASYASSFTISNLLDVDEVIRESKTCVSNLIQLFFYIVSTFIASKLVTIVFVANAADHAPNARFFYNFTSVLIFPLLIPLSKPSDKSTPYTPVSSFMNLYSHLVIWGNTIILTLPIIATFIYFKSTDEFVQVAPRKVTFADQMIITGNDSTVMFLIVNLLWTSSVFALYSGKPWKLKFYEHIPLLVVFILNVIGGIVVFFITDLLAQPFEFIAIQNETAAVILGIVCGGIFLQQIFNVVVNCCDMDKKIMGESQ